MTTKKKARRHFLTVVEIETGKEVHRVDVTKHGERAREKVERGMLMRIDRERFFVGEATS